MTISKESYRGSKDWIMAYCQNKGNGQDGCHKDGRTLAYIEHDPHDDPDPIVQAEADAVMATAVLHDKKFPTHNVRIIHYYREANG